jgi:hypothetical protein
MSKRKPNECSRLRLEFDVLHAYQRHYGSTTQREDDAADLSLDLASFRSVLDHARRLGFDIETPPDAARSGDPPQD